MGEHRWGKRITPQGRTGRPSPFGTARPTARGLPVVLMIALIGGLATMGTPQPAAAQAVSLPEDTRPAWRAPRWVGDITFLGSNALLGGLTAGVMQKMEGGDFRDGFTRGAFGGAVAYLGRRVSAERFGGAGLLGRHVSAVGTSMARNAAEARPSLERLVFPVGPVRLYLDLSDGFTVRPRVNLYELAWTTSFALRSETEFDLSASLSAGAPVFRTPNRSFLHDGGTSVDGLHAGSVIGLSDVPDDLLPTVFAHERVHVLQHDFAFLLWSDPIEKRLLETHRVTTALSRYVDLGVTFPALRGAVYGMLDVDHGHRLVEIEAMFLDRRRR